MEKFDAKAVTRLNAMTERAIKGIEGAIKSTGVKACVTGGGSMFRVHLKERPPRDFRETYPTPDEKKHLRLLLDHLFEEGFILIDSGSAVLSTPMTDAEINALVNAFSTGFEKIASIG
jgi:glutamate-1-semialdehyde 2,1-aminomutase